MKKTFRRILVGSVIIVGSVFPILPSDQQLLFSYQYPVSEYPEMVTDAKANDDSVKIPNPQPRFEDDNKDGLISVSVFQKTNNEIEYIQISELKYSEIGKQDGYSKNPKRSEWHSLAEKALEAITPIANAAIAFDAFVDVTTTTATSLTYAHTTAGSDRILVVAAIVSPGGTTSGVTYNGVAMTNTGSLTMTDDSSRTHTLWHLVAPATGSNNVVITVTASVFIRGTSTSYTGVDQTTPINGTPTKIENTAISPVNVNITSTVADTWGVGSFRSDDGTQGNGTMTIRAVANSLGYLDTNGGLGTTGTEALNFTIASNHGWLIAALIAPSVSVDSSQRRVPLIIVQ